MHQKKKNYSLDGEGKGISRDKSSSWNLLNLHCKYICQWLHNKDNN